MCQMVYEFLRMSVNNVILRVNVALLWFLYVYVCIYFGFICMCMMMKNVSIEWLLCTDVRILHVLSVNNE